ncbi:MAG TPA: T9SS type A sorting domain-containing protein, partial [Bacteroidia bacterium]|nr:T9SS type A sorting domain-containing protein [Bacteroidia bacterium]
THYDTLIASAPGNYTVTGTSCKGCSAIDTFTIHNNVITGLNILKGSTNISAYPNPVTSKLYISANATAAMPSIIKITDVTGKEVMNFTTSIIGTEAIDVHTLPEGMYFIQVITEKSTQTIKFIKN